MAVWEVDLGDKGVFEVESDTEPTAADIQSYLQQQEQTQEQPQETPNTNPLLDKEYKNWDSYKDLTGWSGDATAFYSNALNWGTIGMADLATSLMSPEELEVWKEARNANPIYSVAGGIAGLVGNVFVGGVPAGVGALARVGVGAGLKKLAANTTTQKIAGGVAKYAAEGATVTALANTTKTIDAVAGTEDWNVAMHSWQDFGHDTLFNGAFSAIGGEILAPAAKFVFSPSYRAMRVIGEENLAKGKQAYKDFLAQGLPEDEAATAARSVVLTSLSEGTLDHILKIANKYEDFNKALTEQVVGNNTKGIVVDTLDSLTEGQTAQYSKTLNQKLYGEGYRNQLGATSPDFSLGGVLHSMGLSAEDGYTFTKQAAEVRNQALTGAQRTINTEVANTGIWGGAIKAGQIGRELKSLLGADGYDSFLTKMAQNRMNLARRATPEATIRAESQMRQEIDTIVQEMGEGMPGVPPEAIQQMAVKKYIDNLITTGTNDIYTLDQLHLTIENAFPKQVEEGLKSAFGRYNTKIINEILDNPLYVGTDAEGLFMTNQSLRWRDKVKEIYNKAYKFTDEAALGDKSLSPQQIKQKADITLRQLDDYLNQGISADEAVVRKALFKGAVTNRFLETAKSGNTAEAAKIKSWVTGKGDLVKKVKLFSPGEFDEYYKMALPEIQAAKKIEQIYNNLNTNRLSVPPDQAEAVAKAVSAAATAGMTANATRIGIMGFWDNLKFGGPKTAQKVSQYLENPSWINFNEMVDSAQDPVAKMLMQRMIMAGVNAADQSVSSYAIDTAVQMVPPVLRAENKK